MNSSQRILACGAILAALGAGVAEAQVVNDWIGAEGGFGGDGSSFSDGGNWSFLVQPDSTFDQAKIGSDSGVPGVLTNPVVNVDGDLSATPTPQLILGEGGLFHGTLNIGPGDTLVVGPGAGGQEANLVVGLDGGQGTLNVTGGALNIGNELATPTAGNAASAINLSGSASVNAAEAFLDKNLLINGENVSLNITGNAILGGGGTHTWSFGAAGPSAISVGGQLDLGGTLRVDTQGVTPAIGQSFLIADSASVINGFGAVDVSLVPGLSPGVSVRTDSAPGGVNGVETSIIFEQQPILTVNRRTGLVTLTNPGTSDTLEFDTYVIRSPGGSLVPGAFQSIAPTDGWQVANASTTALSELNPTSVGTVAGQSSFILGNVFLPADQPVGQDTDDVTFQFSTPGDTFFTNGFVVYEGIPTDTLTLNVDRTTGEAQILNGFREAVSIDTYVITSESESLDPSPSGWNVIGGDWQIGANETGTLSELNPTAELEIARNEGVMIGAPFDFDSPSAAEDLVFRFTLPGDDFFRFGKVVFGDELTMLPQGVVGDSNGDGVVNTLDIDAFVLALTNPAQYAIDFPGVDFLANNDIDMNGAVNTLDIDPFVALLTGGVGSPAAPEPSTLSLMFLSATGLICSPRRRPATR